MTKQNKSAKKNTDEVEKLINDGLNFFGLNKINEAAKCWQKALSIDPENKTALDYLHSAGIDLEPPAHKSQIINFPSSHRNTTPPETDIERKGERAVVTNEKTGKARKGIVLSEVPRLVEDRFKDKNIVTEEKYVISFVDGNTSLASIIRRSQFKVDDTRRILIRLLKKGYITVTPKETETHPVPEGSTPKQEPADLSQQIGHDTQPLPYEIIFEQAMRAYLRRDFEAAVNLFNHCVELKPDDPRPRHNLERIKNRKKH